VGEAREIVTAVPGRRLVVDGMNVIGSRPTGWWRDRPGAMAALVADLGRYAAASKQLQAGLAISERAGLARHVAEAHALLATTLTSNHSSWP